MGDTTVNIEVSPQQDSLTRAISAKDGAQSARDLAEKWATEGEDVEVADGKYSALHHRMKSEAAQSAAEAAQSGGRVRSVRCRSGKIECVDL